MKGSLKVSIRTPADMKDVWLQVSKGENVVLWCEGVGHNSSDSDVELPKKRQKKREKMSALEEMNERIEDIVKSLHQKHNDHYTPIQYRLWAEMVEIGTHRYVYFIRSTFHVHEISNVCFVIAQISR